MDHQPATLSYVPVYPPVPLVGRGEFVFAAVHFEHGHIYNQCNGLLEAGGTLKWIYDPDSKKVADFLSRFPCCGARVARTMDEILTDPGVHLVVAAGIPCQRASLGVEVMYAGKDYFTAKCPFTTLARLEQVRSAITATQRKFFVYYSERLDGEAAWHAGTLVRQGAIGRVVHISITGPHRLRAETRPPWFFDKSQYGGILADLGSHQCEQFLYYGEAVSADVLHARVENFAHPQYPELEDFGEAVVQLNNGVSCHSRVDWFTPEGLSSWGDGRTVIVGTNGYMEVRKDVDLCQRGQRQRIYLTDAQGEHLVECSGKVGFPFFSQLVRDCLDRTSLAMTQEHILTSAELSLFAQEWADRRRAC